MEQLTLTTPALLFSAISLIMLAYTNRFLAYAAVVRSLHDKYKKDKNQGLVRQIKNLRKRLYLTRAMQIFGISSLLLCVLTMFLIYIEQHIIAVWIFGIALITVVSRQMIPQTITFVIWIGLVIVGLYIVKYNKEQTLKKQSKDIKQE